jgi:hypothetical protein
LVERRGEHARSEPSTLLVARELRGRQQLGGERLGLDSARGESGTLRADGAREVDARSARRIRIGDDARYPGIAVEEQSRRGDCIEVSTYVGEMVTSLWRGTG